jgi:hypothetical protein
VGMGIGIGMGISLMLDAFVVLRLRRVAFRSFGEGGKPG